MNSAVKLTRHSATAAALILLTTLSSVSVSADEKMPTDGNWHQAAGPAGNWQVEGTPTVRWSVTRDENIRWRTVLPEAGMSNVTVWKDSVFVTTHVPISSVEEKEAVKDIVGYCLDASTGKIRWQVTLPGNVFISLAGGFTDGTVFAPLTDGEHVWFFNRCGSMACFDFEGNQIWIREWTPRFKHNNRQAEPFLVGDTIVYLEVANKQEGAKIQKWASPGVKSSNTKVPTGVDPRQVWTYLHGIEKGTGQLLWRENVGTSVHNTPVIGTTAEGKVAISHARGGGHGPLEKPYGQSLTSLEPGHEGVTLWNTELSGYDPSFGSHWDERYVYGFHKGKHVVLEAETGEVLREQPLYGDATVWRYDQENKDWSKHREAVQAGKGHPNTNQANLVVGQWHWFLSHNVHYLGRVHVESGKVEYLELPSQLMPSNSTRDEDVWLWGKGNPKNRPLNAAGFAVGNKGHDGTGWGHISAASPTRVGHYLFLPVVTGTVYVVDTRCESLAPDALVSVNDLGEGGKTWCLASITYANEDLFAHTMREVICIGNASE